MRKSLHDSASKLNRPQSYQNHAPCEPLESRMMLSSAVAGSIWSIKHIPANNPTTANLADTKNGPMANTSDNLIDLYRDYRRYKKQGGSDATYRSGLSNLVMTKGKWVGVTVRGRSDLSSLTNRIRATGGRIVYRSGAYRSIEAVVPISQLHSLAVDTTIATINEIPVATTNQAGSAGNQADIAEQADKVRSTYGLDGKGVKVGVLSDSVNAVSPGIAGSISTGDLPTAGIQVIQDNAPQNTVSENGSTDEGRAMLELIHDIAPGASLAFATAFVGGQQGMAENIRQLHAAGANVIVDDVSYFAEPMFQPGVIDQAIHDVTQDGAVYLSSASNNNNTGYEAPTNFVTVKRNNYVNFDPSGATVQTRLRIKFSQSGGTVPLTFEWDNPYNGVVGSATTDLDIYFYDPNYPNRILASGTANNIKTGLPIETLNVPVRTMDVVIRVADHVTGQPYPTRFKFQAFFNSDVSMTTDFPQNQAAIIGHNGGPDTISVGAVAFYDAPPFSTAIDPKVTTIKSEVFSSNGPVTQIFDADGNRLSTPLTLQKPDLSGIDAVDTSFFGGVITQDNNQLPNFSGTSAAAPDVAAVAALIKQADPSATQARILSALKSTASPTNGTQLGVWDPKGGFGLVNALAAVEQFVTSPTASVVSVSPNPIASPVSSLKIVFSQQVNGFDIGDLSLTLDGGANRLNSSSTLSTTDGGRTWILGNLSGLTDAAGTYNLTLADTGAPIVNVSGLPLSGGASTSWIKLPPQTRPKGPTSLTAAIVSNTKVLLNWHDNSIDEQGFTLQRAQDADFSVKVKNFTIGPNTTTFTDTTAPQGQKVYYRVRAFNHFAVQSPSSWSNIVSLTTLSAGEVIVDNSGAGVRVTGDWTTDTSVPGFYGSDALDNGNSGRGTKSVRYTPTIQTSGDYYVYARWTRATNRATNVPIDINSADGTDTVVVDQRNSGGNGWVLLGKFHFVRGSSGSVVVRTNGTNGHVIADAIRFLPATA